MNNPSQQSNPLETRHVSSLLSQTDVSLQSDLKNCVLEKKKKTAHTEASNVMEYKLCEKEI